LIRRRLTRHGPKCYLGYVYLSISLPNRQKEKGRAREREVLEEDSRTKLIYSQVVKQ
jgi:hypothetical protein